jgi:hypothetical protein
MPVDSAGSIKPLASPIATTFRFHRVRRRPMVKRGRRGPASVSPSSFAISVAVDRTAIAEPFTALAVISHPPCAFGAHHGTSQAWRGRVAIECSSVTGV